MISTFLSLLYQTAQKQLEQSFYHQLKPQNSEKEKKKRDFELPNLYQIIIFEKFRLILHICDVVGEKGCSATSGLSESRHQNTAHARPPTRTLYLQCINIQTVLQLSLPLSTAGLGPNYIWAEAAVQ